MNVGVCNSFIHDSLSLLGLFRTVQESSDIAESVLDSHGTYFIPAFHGLQVKQP
jgi:glycerol kinase